MRASTPMFGFSAVSLALALLAATPSVAPASPRLDTAYEMVFNRALPAVECAAVAAADFSEIQDAPARVTTATLVEANADRPAHCLVQGHVLPSVGFELRLPTSGWNGKFFEVGCGGFCGNITQTACDWPLTKGYACIASDMGSKSGRIDAGAFYNNLQAQLDFGFRGAHVTALAGKAITEYYYGKAPSRAYFHGCSSGGQQALSEAQRFPWDFDGIIVGAPSPTFSGPMMYYEWSGRNLLGKMTPADLQVVYDNVMAKCDGDDGLKDGIIGDPRTCKADPAELQCHTAKTTACLTMEQVTAVKKVYAGPTTSKGEKIYTGGPMRGSELTWYGSLQGVAYYGDGAINQYPVQYFRYVGFMPAQGPKGKYIEFDYDRDYKRLGMAEALFGNANNPDLRKFATAGGKLIMYNGWADNSDIPSDAIDYYETAEKVMGGRSATQKFFRTFTIPGMYHCTGGPGAFAIDYVSYLEAWVERGQAPDVMIGVRPISENRADWVKFPLDRAKVSIVRPVYPYPLSTKYKGTGDPNDPASYRAVEP
jgi:hypothetical protein